MLSFSEDLLSTYYLTSSEFARSGPCPPGAQKTRVRHRSRHEEVKGEAKGQARCKDQSWDGGAERSGRGGVVLKGHRGAQRSREMPRGQRGDKGTGRSQGLGTFKGQAGAMGAGRHGVSLSLPELHRHGGVGHPRPPQPPGLHAVLGLVQEVDEAHPRAIPAEYV